MRRSTYPAAKWVALGTRTRLLRRESVGTVLNFGFACGRSPPPRLQLQFRAFDACSDASASSGKSSGRGTHAERSAEPERLHVYIDALMVTRLDDVGFVPDANGMRRAHPPIVVSPGG